MLLIIFMLTAHVMEFGIEVDVPKVRTSKDSREGTAGHQHHARTATSYLNEKPVNINLLGTTLQARYRGQAVYVRADKGTPWDPIAQVLGELGAAKITVNMVTQPEDSAAKRRR